MKSFKRMGFAIALLAAFAGVMSYRYLPAAPEQQTQQKPIDFAFPDTKGIAHHVSEWKDKILIVNFWATWCPPCREEMPEFVKLQNEFGGKGVQFIGIALEEVGPVAEYLDTFKINYPILIGNEGGTGLARELGNVIGALPFTVVIDRNGTIAHMHPGIFRRDKVIEVITPLL